jgi:hypothetical protein
MSVPSAAITSFTAAERCECCSTIRRTEYDRDLVSTDPLVHDTKPYRARLDASIEAPG